MALTKDFNDPMHVSFEAKFPDAQAHRHTDPEIPAHYNLVFETAWLAWSHLTARTDIFDMADEQLQTAARYVFEERAFNRYFINHVTRELAMKEGLEDQDIFCRRDDKGQYESEGLEPAWWAFRTAVKMSPALRITCLQAYHRRILPVVRPKKKPLNAIMGRF